MSFPPLDRPTLERSFKQSNVITLHRGATRQFRDAEVVYLSSYMEPVRRQVEARLRPADLDAWLNRQRNQPTWRDKAHGFFEQPITMPLFDAIVCIIVAAGIGAMLAIGSAF